MRTRTLLGLVFGAVIGISMLRGYWWTRRIDTSLAQYDAVVAQHERSALALRGVESLAMDMETGVRGFELTRLPEFLGPYERSVMLLEPALARLATPGLWSEPGSVQAVAIGRGLRDWDGAVATPVVRGLTTDVNRLATQLDGKRRMDAIRALLAELDDEVVATRATEGNEFRALREELVDEGVIVGALTAMILALLGLVTLRGVHTPLLALVGYAERAGRGAREPIAVTGVHEIRVLGAAMSQMAERLSADNEREVAYGRLVTALTNARSVSEVAAVALQSLVDETGARGGCLLVERAGTLELLASSGARLEDVRASASALADDVRRTGTRKRIELSPGDEGFVLRSALVDVTPRTVLAVPIANGRAIVGVIELLDVAARSQEQEVDRILLRVGLALEGAMAGERSDALRAELAASNQELQAQNEEMRTQEEALRAQSEELQRSREQIGLRNDELERATRAKSDFLAKMSHELRTPLNAVIGFSELLASSESTTMTAEEKQFAHDIHDSGEQLLALVNDVLDLAKVEAGALTLAEREFDLEAELAAASASIRHMAARRRVSVEHARSGLLVCRADPSRVRQVVLNLLSNAIKFSPEGATVGVSARIDGSHVRVEVRDRGVGIEPRDVARLFQPFSQLGDGRAVSGGAGLGLAIVRELVERMRGRTGVESERGSGSTFWFTLPLGVDKPSVPAGRPSPDASRRAALVVEDAPADARAFEDLLARDGYAVTIAPTAEAALRHVETQTPALVIVDLGLPDMPGSLLVQRLRDVASLAEVPFVAITGRTLGEAERDELRRAGATMVAEKGVMTGAGFLGSVAALVVARARARIRVLIVDDGESNRRVAREMLPRDRFEVIEASSGQAALDLLEREAFGVVLMDVQMPEMDGLTATRAIHARAETHGLPVIALTAQAMVGDRERALEAGCAAYVTKPVGRRELVATIEGVLASTDAPSS